MLKNYLTVAWRTLRRGKVYAIINVGGLAVAMAACLLIGLFVQQELSFDDFHEKADRVFLAGAWMERDGEKAMFGTPFEVGETLEERFSQVEAVARTSFPYDAVVKTGGARYEDQALYAGARFFDVFTFPLAQGDPQTALAEPNTVVLTPQTARKYFGDEDPMGRTLTIEARREGTYVVGHAAMAARLCVPRRAASLAFRGGGVGSASPGSGDDQLAGAPRRADKPGAGAAGRVGAQRRAFQVINWRITNGPDDFCPRSIGADFRGYVDGYAADPVRCARRDHRNGAAIQMHDAHCGVPTA